MKVVIQRVSEASVAINGGVKSSIKGGLMVLVGFEKEDVKEDLKWISNKVLNLRIFNDQDGVMNRSIQEIDGDILVVSQFTLHARTKKGNRPSYVDAAPPEISVPLYNQFVSILQEQGGKAVLTGEFGANMKVKLINDGPVTIIIDSKNRL
ncbi:D-tyrosyl-tRNA(Tyr) deacylase [Marinilabiliaceae bacterium JC017]|nr:D-tyrosyl-tRNA(Tyr) deacylase [Marinilabiliaceae bacterium JC017]